jgi:hypothetical protein
MSIGLAPPELAYYGAATSRVVSSSWQGQQLRRGRTLPGFNEFVSVVSIAQAFANSIPEDSEDRNPETWDRSRLIAEEMQQRVSGLVEATTGTQKARARELGGIIDQLVQATGKCRDYGVRIENAKISDDEKLVDDIRMESGPEFATVRTASTGLANFLEGFDQKKLKAKRFIFS